VPATRNYARERAAHDAASIFARIHHDLTTQLPDRDHALIGHTAILDFVINTLQLRRMSGLPPKWHTLLTWRRTHGCPILRGHHMAGLCATAPVSTQYALTAWMLSQFTTAAPFTTTPPERDAPVQREPSPPARSDAHAA
jgi:hypothetical protein